MVGCNLLRQIDLRCRSGKPNKQNEPFGGLFVYLFGDIKQLPPVKDRPLYSDKTDGSDTVLEGQLLFQASIDKYFFLNTSFRQCEDEQLFRNILDRLNDGETTNEDYKTLMTRCYNKLTANEQSKFSDAIRLYSTNADVKMYND